MIRKAALLLALALLAACGGGGSLGPTAPTDLSYPSPPTYTVGTAIAPLVPTVTGTVTNYSVSPTLPAGLALNAGTGVISGTPTAASASTTYTVTASNRGGSTTAGVTIEVTAAAAAPAVSYPSLTYTFTVGTAADIVPVSTGGPSSGWTISPALPPGLTLNATTGTITGTPTTASGPASYVVTAQNSGGKSQIGLTLQVVSKVLLDLGHSRSIAQLLFNGTRLLSEDAPITVDERPVSRCNLWNTTTDTLVARAQCTGQIALAGPTAVIEGSVPAVNGLEVLASATGAVQARIATPFSWWQLASDGSYIVLASSTGLSVFSPTGQTQYSAMGDYSGAKVFAAPDEVLIALGPAGQNVIQTVAIPAGTSSSGPPFSGTFNEWFTDGSHFQTTVGTSVYTYTRASVRVDLTTLQAFEGLGGTGNYFWTVSGGSNSGTINVYRVGASSSPALTTGGELVVSDDTLGLISGTNAGAPQLTIVNLSGASPTQQTYALPTPFVSTTAYAAVSASDWYLGSGSGVILDGTTVATTPKYLTYGQAYSVAAGGGLSAIATASGQIVVVNEQTAVLEATIPFLSNNVQMSTDGTVLAASGLTNYTQYEPDESLNVYSLPSGSLINSWMYTYGTGTQLLAYTLAPTGTLIGQVTSPTVGSSTQNRQVTADTGGAVLWSDTHNLPFEGGTVPSVQFSPDGTLIAASTGDPDAINSAQEADIATNIYQNYALTEAVSGWAVGWITNTELLTNTYEYSPQDSPFGLYTGATIYSPSGTVVAKPPLPELRSLVPVNSSGTEIYSPTRDSIYAIPSGSLIFGSGSLYTQSQFSGGTPGAFSPPDIVFAWGSLVVAVQAP